MIRGLYTSAWSMLAKSKEMDVISNNLANVNTNGYKKDITVFETFSDVIARRTNDNNITAGIQNGDIGTLQLGSDIGQIYTNYKTGAALNTGSKLDFAIDLSEKAFFAIGEKNENDEFEEVFTRDGSFSINEKGFMVNKNGKNVMGQNGPIQLTSENFSVSADGSILVNNEVVDKLKIKQFTDTNTLRKIGENLIRTTEQSQEEEFTGMIRQGFLEQSNVNSVMEMVDMIKAMRSYEASQKLMQFMDGTLEKVSTEVGVVR